MATALPFASCMPPLLAAWNQLMRARAGRREREEETPPDESSWPNMTESTLPIDASTDAYLTGRMLRRRLAAWVATCIRSLKAIV